jgi:hypothetical protein
MNSRQTFNNNESFNNNNYTFFNNNNLSNYVINEFKNVLQLFQNLMYNFNKCEERKLLFIGDNSNLTNKMLYLKKILEETHESSGSIFVNGDIGNGFKPYFRPE